MMTKQAILKMVKGVSRHASGRKLKPLVNPERDWGIGLVCFLIILLGVSFYNIGQFFFYLNIEQKLSPSEVVVPNYNIEGMNRVIETYSVRKREYDTLRESLDSEQRVVPADKNTDAASAVIQSE